MVEKTMVSCNIPPEWNGKIERIAAERKQEISQIIYEAIALYLGEDVLTTDTRLSALETEVSTLKSQLQQLNLAFTKLQQQLHTAASIMTVPYAASAKPYPHLQPVQFATEDDSIEDEPDEILTDFLPPELR